MPRKKITLTHEQQAEIADQYPILERTPRELWKLLDKQGLWPEYDGWKTAKMHQLKIDGVVSSVMRKEIGWRMVQQRMAEEGLLTLDDAKVSSHLDELGFGDEALLSAEEAEAQETPVPVEKGAAEWSLSGQMIGELDPAEIARQLDEGQGREADYTECVLWVADNIDNARALPLDAPSNVAFSMLLSAREDRKGFYSGLRQTMQNLQKLRAGEITDEQTSELISLIEKFEDFKGFELERSRLQEVFELCHGFFNWLSGEEDLLEEIGPEGRAKLAEVAGEVERVVNGAVM